MPYKHSGEIGDVWKHLPLCDVLKIEKPKRYFETNSAFAKYKLDKNERVNYGIFTLYEGAGECLRNSAYLEMLDAIDFKNKNIYYGSPALAMTILGKDGVRFFFHDIEKEPLDDIVRLSEHLNIRDKVNIESGDSIEAFLNEKYRFDEDDFVFIDPYSPFNGNAYGKTFFDVFEKVCLSHAKTVLWYGYDNLSMKYEIINKLKAVKNDFAGVIYTFDAWQKSIGKDTCGINPGVPGCGIAAVNISGDSIRKIKEHLLIISQIYKDKLFEGEDATLETAHQII